MEIKLLVLELHGGLIDLNHCDSKISLLACFVLGFKIPVSLEFDLFWLPYSLQDGNQRDDVVVHPVAWAVGVVYLGIFQGKRKLFTIDDFDLAFLRNVQLKTAFQVFFPMH
jgi:hypothetical protein